MAKITGIEVFPLLAKFKKPFSFSGVTRVSSNNVILKINTDEGVYGVGEACPVPAMSGETNIGICAVIKNYFEPLLKGQDPLDLAILTQKVEKCVGSNVVAKAGINIALYDLAGKLLNVPVYQLLGGKYRSEIPINGSVGLGTAEQMLETCEEQMEVAGCKYLKLYAGKEPIETDIPKLKKIIRGVGDRAQCFLDINQQWTPKTAIKAIRSLEEDVPLLYVEQPTAKWDYEGMRFVRENVVTPIAADESVFSLSDITNLARNQACDVITIYALKPGGILRGHQAITMSENLGMDCFIGSYLELGVGTAAGIHLSAAIPKLRYPCYMFGPLKYQYDVLKQDLDIKNGMVKVPEGPGLGIELDMEKLELMKYE